MLMVHTHPALQFQHHLPYGALLHDRGVQFVTYSRSATAMRLLLYDRVDDLEPVEIISFEADCDRWGDVWSIFVPGIHAGQLYHLGDDPQERINRWTDEPERVEAMLEKLEAIRAER